MRRPLPLFFRPGALGGTAIRDARGDSRHQALPEEPGKQLRTTCLARRRNAGDEA